jgi:hypothetical protein
MRQSGQKRRQGNDWFLFFDFQTHRQKCRGAVMLRPVELEKTGSH